MTDEEVVRLGRELPFAEPSTDQVEEMRTAVIASMPGPIAVTSNRTPRMILAGAVVVAAAAAVVVRIMSPSPSPSVSRNHATIVASGDARVARFGGDLVWVSEGIVEVDASRLGTGGRARIIAGDGDVEARGAAFEVEAHRDHLAHVAVRRGHVEVRWQGQVRLLAAGESWDATVVAVAPVVASEVAPPASPAVASASPPVKREKKNKVAPTATPAQIVEQTFRDGWDALQAGDASIAANAFDRVVTLDPHGELAEDAEFWRADALKRAGRPEAARAALATFLTDFPHSLRAGEVAVKIGWLLLDANDLAGAEAQFKRGILDPVERVRTSAGAGLAEIARRR